MEVATTTTTTHRTHITPLVARTAHARRRAHRHTKQITSRSPPSTSSSTPSAHKRPRLRLRRICTQKLPPPSTERSLPSCSLRSNTTTQSPMRQVHSRATSAKHSNIARHQPVRRAHSAPAAARRSSTMSDSNRRRHSHTEATHQTYANQCAENPAMTLPVAQAKSVEVSASGVRPQAGERFLAIPPPSSDFKIQVDSRVHASNRPQRSRHVLVPSPPHERGTTKQPPDSGQLMAARQSQQSGVSWLAMDSHGITTSTDRGAMHTARSRLARCSHSRAPRPPTHAASSPCVNVPPTSSTVSASRPCRSL